VILIIFLFLLSYHQPLVRDNRLTRLLAGKVAASGYST
jgi:hypothetical protein